LSLPLGVYRALMKVGSPPFFQTSITAACTTYALASCLGVTWMEGGGRPGDSLRFAAVTVETADALCRDAEPRLTEMVAWLEPVPARQRSTSGRFMTAI